LWLIEVVGKGKTNAEQNAIGWMMDGPFLVNRLVVLGAAATIVTLTALRFARWQALTGHGVGSEARRRGKGARSAKRVSGSDWNGEPRAPLQPAIGPALITQGVGFAPLPAAFRLEMGRGAQFGRILAAEFRLLMHERSLF